MKTKKQSPYKSQNHRGERRERILKERKKIQIIHLWRIFVFNLISIGIGFVIIENGWKPVNSNQISIEGRTNISASQLTKASGWILPKPLLNINILQLKENLINELPIKSISIRRQLIPAGLHIQIQERRPVAVATRRGNQGLEYGMVDELGLWMPLAMARHASSPTTNVKVEGWTENKISSIKLIINNHNNLGISLKRIFITPNGEIILESDEFKSIKLGRDSSRLADQLTALRQLSRDLPSHLLNQKEMTIDIKDPSQPELRLETIDR